MKGKKVCLMLLLILFAIGCASAVSITISASSSGKSVVTEHYYGANENANYKAEGNGEVSYDDNVNINENARYSGEYNGEDSWNYGEVALKSSHIVRGDGYAIAKLHVMYTGGNGSIDESLNFNANNDAGVLTREMKGKYVFGVGEMVMSKKENVEREADGESGNDFATLALKVNNEYLIDGNGDSTEGNSIEVEEPVELFFIGDHDYVMAVKGDITKSAKDLTPEDIVYKKALKGEEIFSYGIWTNVGAALGDLIVQTDGNKNSSYDVFPLNDVKQYCIYNGSSWECYGGLMGPWLYFLIF